MEPVTVTLGAGLFLVLSAIGTALTIYFRLKSAFEDLIKELVSTKVTTLENTMALRVQALELNQATLQANTVQRSDFSEVKADLKNLMGRVDDLRSLIQAALQK